MAKYKIEVKKSAERELRHLPKQSLQKIIGKIKALADDPHPADSIKLSNQEKYRLRVGRYRVLYQVENDILTIIIVKIGHRKGVYR